MPAILAREGADDLMLISLRMWLVVLSSLASPVRPAVPLPDPGIVQQPKYSIDYELPTKASAGRPLLRYLGARNGGEVFLDIRNKFLLVEGEALSVGDTSRGDPLSCIDLSGSLPSRVADGCLHGDTEVILAEANGGRLVSFDVATGQQLGVMHTPVSSITSIRAMEPLGADSILLTGFFNRKRVHLLSANGDLEKSIMQDPRYAESPPLLTFAGDLVEIHPPAILYLEPIAGTVTVLSANLESIRVIDVTRIPEYHDPHQFTAAGLTTEAEVKRAFVDYITPILVAVQLPEGHLLTEVTSADGRFLHYLWALESPGVPVREVDIPGHVIGVRTTGDLLLDVSVEGRILIGSMRVPGT